MVKTLTIAALVAASFTGSALAGPSRHRAPVDAASYYDTYDRPTAPQAPVAAPTPRSDFGSFGAGATARNLGY